MRYSAIIRLLILSAVAETAMVGSSAATTPQSRPTVVVQGHAPTIERNCPGLPNARVQNLSCSDATVLVSRLREAQARLKNGEKLYFDLLSGAPASDPMTRVAPRQAFLNVSFDRAFIIERVVPSDNLAQRYKFVFRPDKTKSMVWDIEVIFLFRNERLGRVQMRYGPPPPF